MRRIRELYLQDSTVTIILIGECTWARRFVDWEIQSSIRNPSKGLPNGLLAIKLRESYSKLPERVSLNINSGYSKSYKYPKNSNSLENMIEDAFKARTEKVNLIINPRDRFSNNRSC